MLNRAVIASFMLVITALSLFSCKEPTNIGDGILSGAQIEVVDTFSVPLETIVVDTFSTSFNRSWNDYHPIGDFQDEYSGNVRSGLYSQFLLGGQNLSFGSQPLLDSVTLHITLVNRYGDPKAQLNLRVHELTQAFIKDSTYYNHNQLEYDPYNLAQNAVLRSEKDTIIFSRQQFRVKLDPKLGEKILQADSNTILKDNAQFSQFFKGLYITAERKNSTERGAMFTAVSGGEFNANNDRVNVARIRLWYKNKGDTNQKTYDITAKADEAIRFHNIRYFRNNPPSLLDRIKGEPNTAEQFALVQNYTFTKLIYHIKHFETIKRLPINKATLTLFVDKSTVDEQRPVPIDLAAYESLKDNPKQENLNLPATLKAATYNSSKGIYEFDLTNFVQDLVLGKTKNAIVILPRVNPSSGQNINRAVIGGTKNEKLKPILRVFYTRPPN